MYVGKRRGRWKTVCARCADRAHLCGPSTSPLADKESNSCVEIIAEVLIALLQFLGEVLLQLVGQALVELGWYSVREAIAPSRPPRRIPGILGHAILGAVLGGLSLLILPKHLAIGTGLRIATLVLAPLMSALATIPAAAVLCRFGRTPDTQWWFGNAYVFGLSFALVRFFYAH